ncbi:tetratricopeptide repeat protein [Dyadobacter sandarakinus]|uniref:Tetratricopeptide repeat protein n=1 Tax=Dyadobacter sandarakinus TaxID=2747268 RepID=A0ABX7I348_9BACT|nr:tetratricopeptide repeat protein [Dyadobacter sandarakinus]QRR00511.1 tetratricopeptide repeat protein [Dyadobacter sandarakinus]
MNSTLFENLLGFYEDDPADPFNVYALALEYTKSEPAKAAHFFNKLLTEHPTYLPAYYHAGALFAEMEQIEKAENIYQKGIELAITQQNTKAHQELLRAYRNFLDELDD